MSEDDKITTREYVGETRSAIRTAVSIVGITVFMAALAILWAEIAGGASAIPLALAVWIGWGIRGLRHWKLLLDEPKTRRRHGNEARVNTALFAALLAMVYLWWSS